MIEFLLVFMGLQGSQPTFFEGMFPLRVDSYEECMEFRQNLIDSVLLVNPPPFPYQIDCFAVLPVTEVPTETF